MPTQHHAISTCIILAALAAPAPADWQSGPAHFSAGHAAYSWMPKSPPLYHSLALRVSAGKELGLEFPFGVSDMGWGKTRQIPIPLGNITLAGTAPAGIEAGGDWAASRLTATFADGKISVVASRLSPGILVETTADRLRLFAGQHHRMVVFDDKGKMVLKGTDHKHSMPESTAITPAYTAVPAAAGMTVSPTARPIALPPADKAWMLVWWGKASHFARSEFPLRAGSSHAMAFQADLPLLIAFDQPPTGVKTVSDGGLDFTFAQPGRRLAILPLGGFGYFRAADTEPWAGAFPAEQTARVETIARLAQQYPTTVRETFHYDAAKDEAVFTEQVTFTETGRGRRLAPLPPLAAVAMRQGFPVRVQGTLADTGIVTDFGPLMGIDGADTIGWTVTGLGKYLTPPAAPAPTGKAPAELEAELYAHVDRLIASEPLAPFCFVDNLPWGSTRGEYYWAEPGEVLAQLATIYPALDKARQEALLEHIRKFREAFPPEKTALLPHGKGLSRGGYHFTGNDHFAKLVAEQRGRVQLYALYGLERSHALAGTKPPAESWEACKEVLAEAFAGQEWATLYSQRIDAHPGVVAQANRAFAGAIGAVRLARMMQDQQTEQQALWLLARTAVLRHACSTFAPWRIEAKLVKLPADPKWFWAYRSGNWTGVLETMDWSRPSDDLRQIVEIRPEGIRLEDWSGSYPEQWNGITCSAHYVAFYDISPELAALLGDHAKAPSAALVDRIAWNHPVWYATCAEAILGAEHNMSHPSDAYQTFMARAWLLGERPERLARWIDMPWVQRGDLFHMNKLAATIRRYREGP